MHVTVQVPQTCLGKRSGSGDHAILAVTIHHHATKIRLEKEFKAASNNCRAFISRLFNVKHFESVSSYGRHAKAVNS